MMIRESILDGTRKAMRQAKLFLIVPVMTSIDGRWVAMTRWMPTARASWARRPMQELDVLGADHHQLGQLVDDDDDVGQGLELLLLLLGQRPLLLGDELPHLGVVLVDVADLDALELLVALLHLLDDVDEDDARPSSGR